MLAEEEVLDIGLGGEAAVFGARAVSRTRTRETSSHGGHI
jgi:hypothetical protein